MGVCELMLKFMNLTPHVFLLSPDPNAIGLRIFVDQIYTYRSIYRIGPGPMEEVGRGGRKGL